jgi:hypothetical protein
VGSGDPAGGIKFTIPSVSGTLGIDNQPDQRR